MNRTTLIQVPIERLAAVDRMGSICRTGSRQIELRWRRIVLEMRTIDLCVLQAELEKELQRLDITAPQDCDDEEYILAINHQAICLTRYELPLFAVMVREATEQLPHHVIRWKEIALSLYPRACRLYGVLPYSRN